MTGAAGGGAGGAPGRAGRGRAAGGGLVGSVGVPLVALAFSFALGAALVAAIGRNPGEVYAELLRGTLGTPYGIGQVLFKATPLIFTGLACALAFRAGLFNIGAEGQLYVGAFATAWAGLTFPGLPAVLLVPLCLAAGALAGAAWGAVPGYLKARFGAHEVINTIMLNFVAIALTGYFVAHVYVVAESMHTPEIAPAARLWRLERFLPALAGSPVNVTFLLALACAAACGFFLWRTRAGYELRVAGLSATAAEYAGVRAGPATVGAMALSGALAGLGGSNFVMGYKHYFETGFSNGIGFMGLAVALLGRNHPAGVVLAALLFGVLSHGALVINTLVPKELVEIIQAVVILSVIVSSNVFQDLVRVRRKARVGAA
ncbi:MAG TPA: ABC transporter permease [Candidatus Saccharimonadales bacterium]|nr:ABC transporter permease [Candidatus Saccharimonadales bacterium]